MAHHHAFKGDCTKLRAALKQSPATVTALSKDRSQSLLYIASRFGHLDCVKLLVEEFSANVDLINGGDDKSTALHGAAYGGYAEIVAYLLDQGAKVVKNGHGETPQDNAKDSDAKPTVKSKMARLLNNAGGSKKKQRGGSDDDGSGVDGEGPPAKASKNQGSESAPDKPANSTICEQQQSNSDGNSRFYNQVARQRAFASDVKRDKYGNVAGAIGDLGNDGAFQGWNLLLFDRYAFGKAARSALEKKGWKITVVTTEAACEKSLNTGRFDVVVLIPHGTRADPRDSWLKAMVDHHKEGKGILLSADNAPFYAETNAFLEPTFKFTVGGCAPSGTGVLKPGDPEKKGQFDATNHMITAGIDAAIYEGHTVCFPNKKLDWRWTIFGTSTDGHPVLMSTSDAYAGGEGKPGRVVLDCGFTKFWDGQQFFEQAIATDRYLTNAVTWLANVERSERSATERQPQKGKNDDTAQ